MKLFPYPAERLWLLYRSGRGTCSGQWLPFLTAFILAAATVAAVPAQTGPPPGVRVSLVADSTELTVGDLVTLSLIVSHPEDTTVVVPRLEREWGPFEVQAQTSVQTVSLADGVRTVAKQFRVTLFAPGTFETPEPSSLGSRPGRKSRPDLSPTHPADRELGFVIPR